MTHIVCCKNGCPNSATEEILFLMRQSPNTMTIESPIIVRACGSCAVEIQWKDLYKQDDWDKMKDNFENKGMLPPLAALSCLEIRPIIKQ